MTEDGGQAGKEVGEETVREENVKHMEFIQAIIARLAANSFHVKTWCLTITAATYGIAVSQVDWRLLTVGLFVIATFWLLDSYYLHQERLFRLLYDHVSSDIRAVPRFSMNTTRFQPETKRRAAFFSSTLASFYGILSTMGVVLLLTRYYSLF